jgi:hypothetical protein
MTTFILTRKPPQTSLASPSAGTLVLDAMPTATHAGEVEVTDHPVEQGANVVDHKREKPETLTLEGFVSNMPFGQAGQDAFESGIDLAQTAYQQLLAIKAGVDLLTIVTPLRTYASMVMTSLNVPESAQLGGSLSFTASFKQVRVVTSQTVQVPTVLAGKSKDKGGKQGPKPTDPATKEKSKTIFKKVFLKAKAYIQGTGQ